MQQRLIVFCAVADMDLDRVRRVVRALRTDAPELGVLELESLEATPLLTAAGWSGLWLKPLRGKPGQTSALEAHLEKLVQACATELGEATIGVYHDAGNGYARACAHKGDGPTRRAEGDAGRVVRQAAVWMHLDARELADFFRKLSPPPPPVPDADAPEVYVEAEPDDDDRFVEAKLRQARELMEQYRAAQKTKSPD